MNAGEILRRAGEVYSSAESYADRGLVSTVFISDGKEETTRKPFATYFERPARFRFEYRYDEGQHLNIILRNGGAASIIKATEEVKVLRLSSAIAAFAGVSSGSSFRIPSLLMPGQLAKWSLGDLRNPRLEDEEELDGAPCYRISALVNRDERIQYWVGSCDFLIRKILERTHFGEDPQLAIQDARLKAAGIPDHLRPPVRHVRKSEFDTEATTTYSPRLGARFDEQVFNKP